MATLVENAVRIKNTFNDILSAIKAKGESPVNDNDVSTYAAAISDIGGYLEPTDLPTSRGECNMSGRQVTVSKTSTKWIPLNKTYDSNYYTYDNTNNRIVINKYGKYFILMGFLIGTSAPSSIVYLKLYVSGTNYVTPAGRADSINIYNKVFNQNDYIELYYNWTASGTYTGITPFIFLKYLGEV